MKKEILQKDIFLITCHSCGKKLPNFNADGRHNFCPAIKDGEIVQLCMSCKLKSLPKGTL